MTPRSAIGRALAAAGLPVRSCPACGREFDAGLNYSGTRLGAPRGYCSERCRDTSSVQRAAVVRAHRTTWLDLAERHRLEDDGQLELTGLPLAPLPDLPPSPTHLVDQPLPLEGVTP